jgi:hypothetical protein
MSYTIARIIPAGDVLLALPINFALGMSVKSQNNHETLAVK